MKTKIRISILVKSIDGGTGTFLLNFLKINKLFPKEIEIQTLVLEKPTFRVVDKYNFDYFRSKNSYPQRYSLSLQNINWFIKEVFWINKKMEEFRPNIVFGIDMRCNLLAILIKFINYENKIKIIITNHIDLGKTLLDKSSPVLNIILKTIINFFYSKADIIVGVSKYLSSNLKSDFGLKNKVITVYNGQHIKTWSVLHFNRYKKTIVTIARLVEQKDHINLIRATKLLIEKFPTVELLILSDGPKKEVLKSLVKQLKLTEKIKFLGWVDNVKSYLKRADLFVLSSKREGFAYVLIEAMAQAVPIVSTDTPYGPREVLESGKYGVLVPMNDPESLASGILKMLKNKKYHDFYAKKSIERSKYFSTEKMLIGYKKIIKSLVK